MIIRNAEVTSVLAAVRASGASLGSISREGNGPLYTWRLTLALKTPRGEWGLKLKRRKNAAPLRFQRIGLNGRGKTAVCWHGHRNFLQSLFALDPMCEVESPLGRYVGSVDFKLNHQPTAYRELGTPMKPLLWVDACNCSSDPSIADEWGYAGGEWGPVDLPARTPERVFASFAPDHDTRVYDYSPEDGVWTRELADGTVEVLCD